MFLRRGVDLVFKLKLLKKVKVKAKHVSTLSERIGTIWDTINQVGDAHKNTKLRNRDSLFFHYARVQFCLLFRLTSFLDSFWQLRHPTLFFGRTYP